MDESKNNKKSLSRRGFLPLLGGGLLFPFLGSGKGTSKITEDQEEHQILLRPDGTTVKVRKSVIENSNVVEKNISNQSLLSWLKTKK